MSSNLGWLPVKPKKWNYLDTGLKWALRKRYDGDVNEVMTESDIPYLEGLRDAGVKDADDLIEAIEKYGQIHVKEEWS